MDERRLGRRVEIEGELVTWLIDPPKWKRWKERDAVDGRIVNMSVTGAGIVAPSSLKLQRGSLVLVRIQGHEGIVRVRRIVPDDEPGMSYYGVDFREMHPSVERWINETLSKELYPEGDPRWHERHDD